MTTLSPSSSDPPLLSIVVPTYNETARIPARLQEIRDFVDRQEYPAELLIVDDGSDDGTPDLVDRLADGHGGIHTIRNDHRGKAYTVRTVPALVKKLKAWEDYCDGERPLAKAIERLGKV